MQLPVPREGRVSQVVHLADVHIRAGERIRSRFEEYSAVLANLVHAVGDLDSVRSGTAVVLIAGDLFHDKNTISPCGVMLFNRLVEGLADLAPLSYHLSLLS